MNGALTLEGTMEHPQEDLRFMSRALELAGRGRWSAPPNPTVGAVVVSEGRIVGEGFHERRGTSHAEVIALEEAGGRARGATLYVTLEPCNHQGRTPPCTDAIVASGIARVVVAAPDPHPLVGGRGIARLRSEGMEVSVGAAGEEASRVNRRHIMRIGAGRPAVAVKVARTLDGRIAGPGNRTQEITGARAREWGRRRRGEFDAVLVGSGTLLADDPLLSARSGEEELLPVQPARAVADARLRTPAGARLLSTEGGPVYILTAEEMKESERAHALEAAGARVLGVPRGPRGGLDAAGMLSALAVEGIDSIFVEGGAGLIASLAAHDLVDLWHVWIAGKVLGAGPGMLREALEPSLRLGPMQAIEVEGDLLVSALPPEANRCDRPDGPDG